MVPLFRSITHYLVIYHIGFLASSCVALEEVDRNTIDVDVSSEMELEARNFEECDDLDQYINEIGRLMSLDRLDDEVNSGKEFLFYARFHNLIFMQHI